MKKVSELFTKISQAKQDYAKAKEQRNQLRANLAARVTAPLPKVAKAQIPRVVLTPEADCHVVQIVVSLSMPQPVERPLRHVPNHSYHGSMRSFPWPAQTTSHKTMMMKFPTRADKG